MIRVASYCRVSTDRADQANSFEAQCRYFREYIAHHPEWALWEVYADEGISGTSTKKRTQFNRMISDAYAGRFSLIITKEVSRFSRNLLDTIAYTRELKALGVGVLFMNDSFSSLDPDAELRLSIMGSIAQEESRKTSSRVKWGQTRQMERGVVFGTSLLGYEVRNGKLTIEPEGAETVRLIFQKYGVEKKGTSTIARELREAGLRTHSGSPVWHPSHIVKLLRNEKYVGDLVQKKTITPDYLTHAKKVNHGEEEMIILKNHHEPIIDRALWDTVQEELRSRNRHNGYSARHSNRYVFSGKIICGQCGGSFVARRRNRTDGTACLRWRCYRGCGIGKSIRDDLLLEALTTAIQSISLDTGWIIRNLIAILRDSADTMDDPRKLWTQLRCLIGKKEAAMDAFLSGAITREELVQMKARYDSSIKSIQTRLDSPQTANPADLEGGIRSIVTCQRFPEALCKALLEQVIIHKDGTFDLHLRHLPQVWHFALESRPGRCQNDPAVPTSVNNPFSSSKGME